MPEQVQQIRIQAKQPGSFSGIPSLPLDKESLSPKKVVIYFMFLTKSSTSLHVKTS